MKKLALGITLGIVSTGFAQFNPQEAMDYMPVIFLNPAVAKDMHLSPSVASKEQSVILQNGMAMLPLLSGIQSSSQAQKEAAARKGVATLHKMEQETLAPLNPAQRVRYHQLSLQFFGPPALALPKQAHALGLTSAQQVKLGNLFSGDSKKTTSKLKGMSGSSPNPAAMGSFMGSLQQNRDSEERAITKILTPAQLAKWNAMQGKKLPGISNLFGGMGGAGMGGGGMFGQ